jgi:hypothetical protein
MKNAQDFDPVAFNPIGQHAKSTMMVWCSSVIGGR